MRWIGYAVMALIGASLAQIVVKNYAEKPDQAYELIMFSSPLCTYCTYFEQNVAPLYKLHDLGKRAPLIAVNMDEEGTGPYHLATPIKSLPTFVIMKNRKELGRINGLPDKLHFLTFVRNHTI